MSVCLRVGLTLVWFALTVIVACSIEDLGTLWTVFGSTCGYVVMFFVPACGLISAAGPWQLQNRAARTLGMSMLLGGGSICAYCVVISV